MDRIDDEFFRFYRPPPTPAPTALPSRKAKPSLSFALGIISKAIEARVNVPLKERNGSGAL
jgi:hypothetical protein